MSLNSKKVSLNQQANELKSILKTGNFRSKALEGKLRNKTTIRSIYWKVYLGLLTEGKSSSSWKEEMKKGRKKYDDLLGKHYNIDPKKEDEENLAVHNPLSQKSDNIWNAFFKNEELKRKINLDIERLFPEYSFFKEEKIHEQMLKGLFVWSKENPRFSYKQGFHDILGIMVLILSRDCNRSDVDNGKKGDKKLCNIIEEICDKKYVEHDSYLMFDKFILKFRKFYGEKEDDSDWDLGRRAKARLMQSTPIFTICEEVQGKLLKTIDPPLFEHFFDENIQAQLYMLKWIRLLFVRHFHLDDVIILWDGIMADVKEFKNNNDKVDLEILKHLCLNMILYVREYCLQNSHVRILERLMNKYPPVEDVFVFFEKALVTKKNPEKPLYKKKVIESVVGKEFKRSAYEPKGGFDSLSRPTGFDTDFGEKKKKAYKKKNVSKTFVKNTPKPKVIPIIHTKTKENVTKGKKIGGGVTRTKLFSSTASKQNGGQIKKFFKEDIGKSTHRKQDIIDKRKKEGIKVKRVISNYSKMKEESKIDVFLRNQRRLGKLMDDVLNIVQKECEIGKDKMDLNQLQLSCAQLKHVKNILIGAVDFNEQQITTLNKQNKHFLENILQRNDQKNDGKSGNNNRKRIKKRVPQKKKTPKSSSSTDPLGANSSEIFDKLK